MRKEKNTRMKILLADDHQIVRQGMQLILEEQIENAEIFHASNIEQILEFVKNDVYDVAILDAQFPDGNSISVIPEIKRIQPGIRILIFSSFEEETHSLKYIHAGADGFLSKISDEEEIQHAVRQIIENGNYFPPKTQKLMEMSVRDPKIFNPIKSLSERELQIAELYRRGYGNIEIAAELGLKQNTVSTFKKRILEKLNLDNLIDLIEFMKIHQPL